jgi:hypothetical protein
MAVAAELSYGRRRKRIEGFIRVYGEFIKRCRVVMESNCILDRIRYALLLYPIRVGCRV